MFYKKGVLRNFAKFRVKHLCQRLFLNKIAALRPATLLKRSLWHRCFPLNFAKFLRTPFFTEHVWWLLLNFLGSVRTYNSKCNLLENYKKDKVLENYIQKLKDFVISIFFKTWSSYYVNRSSWCFNQRCWAMNGNINLAQIVNLYLRILLACFPSIGSLSFFVILYH